MAEMSYFGIFLASILTYNVIFARFLGICPYLGVSRELSTAFGMSAAVLAVMTLATAITYPVFEGLAKLHIEYLDTISFILVIAALVQVVEIILKKSAPALYRALGIFLPLITTNCAVLGMALLSIKENLNYMQAIVFTVGSAIGFGMALIIFAGVRERLEVRHIPKMLQGAPIGLITAGILALAFMGFSGLGG